MTARNQQVARIDYEEDAEASGAALEALITQVTTAARSAEALVLSDYRKGVVGRAVIDAAGSAAKSAGIPLLVDPKIPQADRYRGATLLTPNHHEAELMTQMPIRHAGRRAARGGSSSTSAAARACSSRGAISGCGCSMPADSPVAEAHFAAAAREVADVTGAGDTVIAVLALGLAAGATLADAAQLSNRAAGLVVARFGPATVTIDELTAAAGAPER